MDGVAVMASVVADMVDVIVADSEWDRLGEEKGLGLVYFTPLRISDCERQQ